MNRFVVVEASPFPDVLRARSADASLTVRLGAPSRVQRVAVIDEHLVVDMDACREGPLLDCADVLQGSHALSAASASRRLSEVLAGHPACGIAAVPVSGTGTRGAGGWALAAASDRSVILVPHGPRRPCPDSVAQSLLPSCLHAWLVAGRSLRQWPNARDLFSG